MLHLKVREICVVTAEQDQAIWLFPKGSRAQSHLLNKFNCECPCVCSLAMLPRLRMLSSQENMSLAGSSDPSFRRGPQDPQISIPSASARGIKCRGWGCNLTLLYVSDVVSLHRGLSVTWNRR